MADSAMRVLENLSWTESYLARVLSVGPVPNHVALLGDGNRRWARLQKKVVSGHDAGLRVYIKMTKFLRKMDCPEVTLFLFSVDNTARPAEQLTELFRLIEEAIDVFTDLSEELEMRVRVLGEATLLPEQMQEKIRRSEEETRHQRKFTLNLAIAYGSRFDITNAIKRVAIRTDGDIDAKVLAKELCTRSCGKVDLLIRTSGETRLSDFFLWEVSV